MSDDSESYEARVGADRMVAGLSCIPDPVRGDLAEVERLKEVVRLQGEVWDSDARRMDAEVERLRGLLAESADFLSEHELNVFGDGANLFTQLRATLARESHGL